MSDSALFSPARLRDLKLDNRIVVSPMCQYSAEDGSATDWHMMHLGMLSNSGAGLLIIEATGVERAGRISPGCLGLYSDENEQALKRVVDACRKYGSAKIGIQLGHAGRKASTPGPWQGTPPGGPLKEGAWQTKAPSAIPFNEGWHVPQALTPQGIEELIEAFVAAARRADRIGLDLIELHGAHGYLLNQFLSPLSNKRDDEWGGSLENRMRFPLEVFKATRAAWPESKPLGMRISAVEWVEGGWTIEDSITLAKRLKDLGCDYIDVSSGGNHPGQRIQVGPGYQVPFAEQIKKAVGIPVMAGGMITEAAQAEGIIRSGQADFVAIARAFLDDPHWAWHAAYRLGTEPKWPDQYRRVGPQLWPPAKRYQANA